MSSSACTGIDALGRTRDGRRGGEQHDRQDVHVPLRQQLLPRLLPRLLAEVNRAAVGTPI